jgi:exonuclease III
MFSVMRCYQSERFIIRIVIYSRYPTGVTCVKFGDITVVGCYLQAGSKNSPGQAEIWYHYSRCRSDQVTTIGAIVKEFSPSGTIIMCGDFNMDLDDDPKERPEVRSVKNLKMIDTWRHTHTDSKDPNYKGVDRGY